MWDEAEMTVLLGVPVYTFGLFSALGALAALITAVCLAKKKNANPGGGLLCFLGMAIGGIGGALGGSMMHSASALKPTKKKASKALQSAEDILDSLRVMLK